MFLNHRPWQFWALALASMQAHLRCAVVGKTRTADLRSNKGIASAVLAERNFRRKYKTVKSPKRFTKGLPLAGWPFFVMTCFLL
jgi:hypothetical protein